MGLFSGMREASPTQGGLYFKEGQYVVRIDRIKMQTSRVNKRSYFIVETTVIESNNSELRPGSKPSQVVELPGKFPELALGNVKDALMGAMGSYCHVNGHAPPTADMIGEQEAEWATGESNPLAGVFCRVNAFNKEKRDGDGVYTRINWFAIDDAKKYAEAAQALAA